MQRTRGTLGIVLPRHYDTQVCSAARALEVVGDRWTMLIVRDLMLGVHRFDDFQRRLGIARNTLTDRLQRLVEDGIIRRRRYQERPERFEYHLTRKGADLWPVLVSLIKWGDRYLAPDGPPRVIRHRDCGGEIDEYLSCRRCGRRLSVGDTISEPGPGAAPEEVLA
jgi:DNA-binding HxlR family transcriptional regulator